MSSKPPTYTMKLSLNVLNHLGLSLYSNVAAVISETVANSWDADAEHVEITLDVPNDRIEIKDDGDGMSLDEINDRYLLVGYQKRFGKEPESKTRLERLPMGRKGIGKLSLFSIANHIELHTKKAGKLNAFSLDVAEIRNAITDDVDDYHPKEITASFTGKKGTRLVISGLKGSVIRTASSLRRRIARRFGVIGPAHKFDVKIDGKSVTAADRDYYHKIEYVWYFGEKSAWIADEASNAKKAIMRPATVSQGHEITGWIGSVENVGALKDEHGENLNRIILMARGKLVQQDILASFGEGGLYAKYLFGEIYADFLDADGQDDIATSNRQEIIEEDERFIALREFVHSEIKNIKNEWNDLKIKAGEEEARSIPAISNWLDTLDVPTRKMAGNFLGKINQIPSESSENRNLLFAHGVLAFEAYRLRSELDKLDAIDVGDLPALQNLISKLDDIEATLYYQITKERLDVIKRLQKHVDENALEKIVQQLLFDHLWLLDPSWDRATEKAHMEERVKKLLDKADKGLTKDELNSRLDIRYKHVSSKHVVIELKRPEVVVSIVTIMEQVGKYRSALQKLFDQSDDKSPLEFIVLLGKQPSDWKTFGATKATNILKEIDTRIVFYDRLLNDANNSYSEYIEKSKAAGRVFELINNIDASYFAVPN